MKTYLIVLKNKTMLTLKATNLEYMLIAFYAASTKNENAIYSITIIEN